MADTLLAQGVHRPPADGQPWDAWLADSARRQRAALLAYRDGARLAAATGQAATTLSVIDQAVAALRRAGFTPAQALRGMLAVHNYTIGFVLEEQADRERHVTPELQNQEAAMVLGGGGYPDLAQAIAEGGDPQGEETFEFGLGLILHGLRATLVDAGNPANQSLESIV